MTKPKHGAKPNDLVSVARALMAQSQYSEAARAYEAAISATSELGEEVAAATLTVEYARSLVNSGDSSRANAAVEEVRPILEAHPGQGLVDLYVYDALSADNGGNTAGTISAAEAALATAEKLGLPRPYRALQARGLSRLRERDVGGATDVRDAIDLAMAADDKRFVLTSLANWAMEMDRQSDAIHMFDEAIAFAARFGLSDGAVRALRIEWLDEAGRWDEALAEVPVVLEAALALGDAYTALMTRMARGGIETIRGEVSEPVDGLLAESVAISFPPYVVCGVLARDAFNRGDYDLVRKRVTEAIDSVGDGEYMTGVVLIVLTCLEMGDLELARRVLTKARPGLLDGGAKGMTDLAVGLVLEAEGDVSGALNRFETGQAFFAQNDYVPYECLALLGMGRCQIATGSPDAGLKSLRRARELAAYLKVPRYLALIDAAIGDGVAAGPESRL